MATSEKDFSENEIRELAQVKYDELNALWVKAEENLRSFLVPDTVCYCYESVGKMNNYLAWARVGQQWRICIGSFSDGAEGSDIPDWKPICDCRLWYRQEMVWVFPKLKEKVVSASGRNLQRLDKSVIAFSDILKSAGII